MCAQSLNHVHLSAHKWVPVSYCPFRLLRLWSIGMTFTSFWVLFFHSLEEIHFYLIFLKCEANYYSFCKKQKLFSVQFSRSVMSDSLWPHELQHTRSHCPSSTPGVHSNSRPSSRWCHPAISSSVILLSSRPQSFPASGSFQMNQLFAWGGQSIGVSASTSVLPMNTQDWSPLEWTGWISLQSKGFSRVFSNTTV